MRATTAPLRHNSSFALPQATLKQMPMRGISNHLLKQQENDSLQYADLRSCASGKSRKATFFLLLFRRRPENVRAQLLPRYARQFFNRKAVPRRYLMPLKIAARDIPRRLASAARLPISSIDFLTAFFWILFMTGKITAYSSSGK